MTSPVGNLMGSTMSPWTLTDSLQWMSVSSRSKTMVLRWVGGSSVRLSSMTHCWVGFMDLANCCACMVWRRCSRICSMGLVMSGAM